MTCISICYTQINGSVLEPWSFGSGQDSAQDSSKGPKASEKHKRQGPRGGSIHQVFRWVRLLVWGARSGSRPLFSLGFMAHQHITIHYRSQTYYRKIPDIHKDILPTTFITSPTPAELAHQCTCGHKISINPNPFCGASVSSEQVTNQSINQQEIRVLFILNWAPNMSGRDWFAFTH